MANSEKRTTSFRKFFFRHSKTQSGDVMEERIENNERKIQQRKWLRMLGRICLYGSFVSLLVADGISSAYQHSRMMTTLATTTTSTTINGENPWNGNENKEAPDHSWHLAGNASNATMFSSNSITSTSNVTKNDTSSHASNTTYANSLQQWASIFSQKQWTDNPNATMLDVPIKSYRSSGSPVSDLLKIYVYEHLEDDLPASYASDVYDWYTHERPESHWITDLPLIRLFLTFPGRTHDPSEADLFVIPYPHAGHCIQTPNYQIGCKQLDAKTVETTVLSNLQYYNQTSKHRHLFFLSDSAIIGHSWVSAKPLLVTYGPIWEHMSTKRKPKRYRSPRGHFVIPPFSGEGRFQPSFVDQTRRREQQEQQHYQPHKNQRDLSLVFIASDKNPSMPRSPRAFRGYLLRELERIRKEQEEEQQQKRPQMFPNHTVLPGVTSSPAATIGGLPFVAGSNVSAFSPHDFAPNELYDLYERSVFCPILAGDITWQRRFFDVIACGCLPVVVAYPLTAKSFRNHLQQYHSIHKHQSNNTDSQQVTTRILGQQQQQQQPVSWYVPEHGPHSVYDTWSVQESYPFVDQIDYPAFVVECEGNATHPEATAQNIVSTLETLLTERPSRDPTTGRLLPTKLQQKQAALRAASTSLVYGVGPDAHRTNDAFAHLIRALRNYTDGL
jgi:hypothetical protein